jgi:secondary thiamine-phosphate synthase enzyme
MESMAITTSRRCELVDITAELQRKVDRAGVDKGMIFVFVPHTTAAITVNENADPSVKSDIMKKMSGLVPEKDGFEHSEGNSDAHIKSSLFGAEKFFFIENGKLALGTWQGVYFCEFDGPRQRKIHFKIMK